MKHFCFLLICHDLSFSSLFFFVEPRSSSLQNSQDYCESSGEALFSWWMLFGSFVFKKGKKYLPRTNSYRLHYWLKCVLIIQQFLLVLESSPRFKNANEIARLKLHFYASRWQEILYEWVFMNSFIQNTDSFRHEIMTVFVNEALNNDVQYPDSFKNNANDSLWVSHCIITQLIISRHRSIQKFESSTESLNHSHQICSKHWFTVINEWPSLWLSYWIIISWFAQEWSKWLWVTEAFTHPLKKP